MTTPDRQSRLDEIARIAVQLEKETQVPANVMVAQWAVESKWGERPVGNANYFGIKKSDRHDKCCTVTTHEVVKGVNQEQHLQFADYDSLEDSCRDYAWMISKGTPYRKAWLAYLQDRSPLNLLKAIAGTYSTSPTYFQLVQQIGGQGNVVAAIAKARA